MFWLLMVSIRFLSQSITSHDKPSLLSHYWCFCRRERGGVGQTLLDCGINEESTVGFSLSSFPDERPDAMEFYFNDVVPSVEQSQKGLSAFFSSLYAIVRYSKMYYTVLSCLTMLRPSVQQGSFACLIGFDVDFVPCYNTFDAFPLIFTER